MFTDDFVTNHNKNSEKIHTLEVDVEYQFLLQPLLQPLLHKDIPLL